MPVSLSEVKKINQILKENRKPITPYAVESALTERRRLMEEAAANTRRARKEIEKRQKQPVISTKSDGVDKKEVIKDIEEYEDDLLPPLQNSLPRMKKETRWYKL